LYSADKLLLPFPAFQRSENSARRFPGVQGKVERAGRRRDANKPFRAQTLCTGKRRWLNRLH